MNDEDSYFYLDVSHYPQANKNLPIGVFDSGTGGLTVLDAVVNFDQHDNETHDVATRGDGVRDFVGEHFVYLADSANMPYGLYPQQRRTDLLREHVIKDAQFLLGNKYYRSAVAEKYQTDKSPVKAIVIACNTATAYGKEDIQSFLNLAHQRILPLFSCRDVAESLLVGLESLYETAYFAPAP